MKPLDLIHADEINGQKARLKLMAALSLTKDSEELRRFFQDDVL